MHRRAIGLLAAFVALLAVPAVFPAGAAARISSWRIASYSLTFTEHATATSSPCDADFDGPAASNSVRATTEDAQLTLSDWKYPYRAPLFEYDYVAHGPASVGEIDPGGWLTEHRHIAQTVVDCETQATSPRTCDSSAPYRGGNSEIWGQIESMRTSRHQHTVTIEWGFPPIDGFDCDGDLGLGPPVPRDALVKTRLRMRAFYGKSTTIRFSHTWSGNDGSGTSGTETLAGTLVLRRATEPGSCFPGPHPDRHFVCTRR